MNFSADITGIFGHGAYGKTFGQFPSHLRKAIGTGLSGIPKSALEVAGKALGVNHLSEKSSKLVDRLHAAADVDDLYRSLVSEWPAQSLVRGSKRLQTVLDTSYWIEGLEQMEARMMAWDTLTYLPDDILHKVDRAAMAASLESRVPFLDHRVVELAWRLPLTMKIRNGQGKWVLRQLLSRYVPAELIERPKSGFALPMGDWLRGPLREWAEGLLEPGRIESEGYLNAQLIHSRWTGHLTNSRDQTAALWSVLMFQSWLESADNH